MKMKQFGSKRGGSRPGAGRPKLEIRKRPVLLSMTVELNEALADAADYSGMSKSQYAEEAIKSRLKRDKPRLAELKRQASREARRLAW
jgi:hypothetical protein